VFHQMESMQQRNVFTATEATFSDICIISTRAMQ